MQLPAGCYRNDSVSFLRVISRHTMSTWASLLRSAFGLFLGFDLIFNCVCISCLCESYVHMGGAVPGEARRGCWLPCSYSYRRLGADHPPEEQQAFFTAKPSLQHPTHFFICLIPQDIWHRFTITPHTYDEMHKYIT